MTYCLGEDVKCILTGSLFYQELYWYYSVVVWSTQRPCSLAVPTWNCEKIVSSGCLKNEFAKARLEMSTGFICFVYYVVARQF